MKKKTFSVFLKRYFQKEKGKYFLLFSWEMIESAKQATMFLGKLYTRFSNRTFRYLAENELIKLT